MDIFIIITFIFVLLIIYVFYFIYKIIGVFNSLTKDLTYEDEDF